SAEDVQRSGAESGCVWEAATLGPANAIRAAAKGSEFFRVREVRSDKYRAYFSDEGRSNRGNSPFPFGLRPKSGHTSLSSLTVVPPQPADFASSDRILASNAVRHNS